MVEQLSTVIVIVSPIDSIFQVSLAWLTAAAVVVPPYLGLAGDDRALTKVVERDGVDQCMILKVNGKSQYHLNKVLCWEESLLLLKGKRGKLSKAIQWKNMHG